MQIKEHQPCVRRFWTEKIPIGNNWNQASDGRSLISSGVSYPQAHKSQVNQLQFTIRDTMESLSHPCMRFGEEKKKRNREIFSLALRVSRHWETLLLDPKVCFLKHCININTSNTYKKSKPTHKKEKTTREKQEKAPNNLNSIEPCRKTQYAR